jgi:hypothetical protein
VGTGPVHVQNRTGSHRFCEPCSERKTVRPISLPISLHAASDPSNGRGDESPRDAQLSTAEVPSYLLQTSEKDKILLKS